MLTNVFFYIDICPIVNKRFDKRILLLVRNFDIILPIYLKNLFQSVNTPVWRFSSF